MQGHRHLLHYPPQPEDHEMTEEGEEANPQLEEGEEASDDESEESLPHAESEEDEEEDEEEEPRARKGGKRRRELQFEEGASSAMPTGGSGSPSALPLVVEPLQTAPPASKKKKYAADWCDWQEDEEE